MKRSLTATYVILGRAHLEADPYDARGAFVLLNSIVEGLGKTAPSVINLVCHLHMVAALGNNGVAKREAPGESLQVNGLVEVMSFAR